MEDKIKEFENILIETLETFQKEMNKTNVYHISMKMTLKALLHRYRKTFNIESNMAVKDFKEGLKSILRNIK